MVFTTFNFLLFFPFVLLVSYLTPIRFRWLTLLVISYLFYTNVKPIFTLLLVGVTLSTYLFTMLIDREKEDRKKKIWMRVNIILILLPLFFFKYFGEINNQLIDC